MADRSKWLDDGRDGQEPLPQPVYLEVPDRDRPENRERPRRRRRPDYDDEASGRRPGRGVSRALWFLLAVWCVLAGILFVILLPSARGAPQEAALAAMGCFAVIGPYIFCRAADETTKD